jgi:hypothetical protein
MLNFYGNVFTDPTAYNVDPLIGRIVSLATGAPADMELFSGGSGGGGGGGGGGYSRGPPDIRGGYNDRGDYRGFDGPHGHGYDPRGDPRGLPGPPIHFSDNRRFRFVISLYLVVEIFCINIFNSKVRT